MTTDTYTLGNIPLYQVMVFGGNPMREISISDVPDNQRVSFRVVRGDDGTNYLRVTKNEFLTRHFRTDVPVDSIETIFAQGASH